MTLYMNNDHIISTLNKELDDLEVKIEELSNKYLDLKKENQLLKERQEQEVAEKFNLKIYSLNLLTNQNPIIVKITICNIQKGLTQINLHQFL